MQIGNYNFKVEFLCDITKLKAISPIKPELERSIEGSGRMGMWGRGWECRTTECDTLGYTMLQRLIKQCMPWWVGRFQPTIYNSFSMEAFLVYWFLYKERCFFKILTVSHQNAILTNSVIYSINLGILLQLILHVAYIHTCISFVWMLHLYL